MNMKVVTQESAFEIPTPFYYNVCPSVRLLYASMHLYVSKAFVYHRFAIELLKMWYNSVKPVWHRY